MISRGLRSIAEEFASSLSRDLLSTDPQVLATYAQDAYWPGLALVTPSPEDIRPDLVVWPRTTEEVAAAVRLAAQGGIPLIAWGGGTGVMGAAIPWKGGIVLDLARHMKRVLAIDVECQTATVQAGILLGDLNGALEPHGLMVGHDPYSQPIATVGGTISTGSVGWRAGRYGSMEDQVLAVEAVLGDGSVIRTRAVAEAVGPPLHRLFSGAEGTLGVVTEATLRLFPQPERRAYHLYRFPTFESGFLAVREMWSLGLRPALLDYGSDGGSSEVAPSDPPLLEEEPSELYLAFEGFSEGVAAEERRALALIRAHGGRSGGAREAQRFWERRHSSAERFQENRARSGRGWGSSRQAASLSTYRSEYLHVALPVSAVLDYHRECHEVARSQRLHLRECGLWTHPGLFSVILGVEGSTPEEAAEAIRTAADLLLRGAQERGGSMEYCHGVGVRLLHLLEQEMGSAGPLLRRIKGALDPAGILNPGKLNL